MVIIIKTYKSYLFHQNSGKNFVTMALNGASELGFLAKFLAEFVSLCALVSSIRPFQVLRTQVSTRTKWWEKRPELGVGFGVGISASSTGNKTNSAISPSFLMDHLYLKHFIKIFTQKFEIFFLVFCISCASLLSICLRA